MKTKTKKKRPNPVDATMRNVRAANKKIAALSNRITLIIGVMDCQNLRIRQLEKWQKHVIGGGSLKGLKVKK